LDAVRKLAYEAGLRVYLVGGPVRDALLGIPVLDLDLSVEGDAVELARELAWLLGGTFTAHTRFGTATVDTAGVRIDLVTARRECYPQAGQLPEVTPSIITDDLARRDFTINAMALPVTDEETGVIDPLGGVEDLVSGTVRILHPRSFVDDPTRMFRAVRYEQRLGFGIDSHTLASMSSAIESGHMASVSGDRWRHEIEKFLEEANPGPSLLRASELGLLAGLHPALAKDRGLRSLAAWTGDPPSAEEWLAALFGVLSGAEAESVVDRLRLTGNRAALARDTIGVRLEESRMGSGLLQPSQLYHVLCEFDVSAIEFWSKVSEDPTAVDSLNRYVQELQFVRTSLSGKHLLELGVPQGPGVGSILTSIRDARLDGYVSNENGERALARSLMGRNLDGATNEKR
jgi:tRNA nucleotidyltransferase (CCA-adding enzyme)